MTLYGKAVSFTATLVAAIAMVLFIGECNSFRSASRDAARVTTAPPTPREERSEVVTLPCQPVKAIEPKPKDREKISETYNRPDLGTNAPKTGTLILGERELPKLPEGGTALATLDESGRLELSVKPVPERLIEWSTTYEIGALYGVGTAGDTRARAWAAAEPLRWGRIHLRAEAGVDLRAGTPDAYLMAGAVWRSR